MARSERCNFMGGTFESWLNVLECLAAMAAPAALSTFPYSGNVIGGRKLRGNEE